MKKEEKQKKIRRLEILRNLLLVLALILVLIPSEFTANWTPRVACIPLFLCIPIVKYTGKLKKEISGEG